MDNNIYNGQPSRILPQRPFFSIAVACYNSRKTIGALLASIVAQNLSDDIEVILSDDCSTESYQDIVDDFKNLGLSIRQVQTDYNFAPGNTREKGASVAEGRWLCFADHDDEFIENSLQNIKAVLEQIPDTKYAIANFVEMNPDTNEVIQQMIGTRNWNHAKFYNMDKLWKAYDIHFKKDLLTHEDIYISSRINCIVPDDEIVYINEFCYIWNSRPTSISRENYENHSFLEVFMKDYLISTGYTYLEEFEKGNIDANYTVDECIGVLIYTYFYMMGFFFHQGGNRIRENDDICREYLVRIKQTFQIDNQFIWNYAAANDARLYMSVFEASRVSTGPYISNMTFKEYLDWLHADIKPLVTMKEVMHK